MVDARQDVGCESIAQYGANQKRVVVGCGFMYALEGDERQVDVEVEQCHHENKAI